MLGEKVKARDKGAGRPVAGRIRAKRQLGEFSFEGILRGPTFREYAEACMGIYYNTMRVQGLRKLREISTHSILAQSVEEERHQLRQRRQVIQ